MRSINVMVGMFPSPYGVSFILIQEKTSKELTAIQISFRLLTELYSFLLI